MKEKKVDKRSSHSYKALTSVYNKAMKAAKKRGELLAQEIEKFVERYSNDLYERQE